MSDYKTRSGYRMTTAERSQATQILWMNLVDYWHEVDVEGGLHAAERFLEDGVMVGDTGTFRGRAAIGDFYRWRVGRGTRTSRHVVTNFRAVFHDPDHATTNCVMLLFAADGEPVLPTHAPIMVADLIDECVKEWDLTWRYRSRRFVPLFKGGAPTTMPPQDWFDDRRPEGAR